MSDTRVVAEVITRTDVRIVSHKAQVLAHDLGFDPTAIDEIGLVVTELGTNLVKHAGGGTVTVQRTAPGPTQVLEILSEDRGPGIADPEWAVTDGNSTSSGLGLGLGTIHRLVDYFEIISPLTPSGGTRVVCRRLLHVRFPAHASPIDVGIATRPRFGEGDNGDAFVVIHSDHEDLVGVIDGLGHGTQARIAAQTARRFVESRSHLSLENLFVGVDRACRATRGVVMALARIQFDAATLEFACAGNIEARMMHGADHIRLIARRGVLGMDTPQPHVRRLAWDAQSVLVMHSDGLTARWEWASISASLAGSSSVVARQLLRGYSRPDDDATVLVAKSKERPG